MSTGRSDWPIHRYQLGQEPPDDLSASTTPGDRLAMMWPLAREGWLIAGRQLPMYSRENVPARIFRCGERPDDE
jgi:hypothetical protein